MKTITIEINGKEIEARPGQTVLEVVEEHNLDTIPTLCHSPNLKPYASCFLCVVELEGRPNLVPSCATPVAPGMKITTRNERIEASRRTALELLLSNHYADCVSPCKEGCPAGVDVQGYLALANMNEFVKAADLIRETNPLPAICGRVCVRKCEVVCRRIDVDSSVAINDVKRYVTDSPGVYDQDPLREPSRGKSVGIVGGGPAGLTAAWFLGRWGWDPVIYESLPKAGGMLRYGIPKYRLPWDVIDEEVRYIERAGATIHCGVEVGKDVTLDELMDRHDAVFLAVGAMEGKGMMVEGEKDTPGVVVGVDYLREMHSDPKPTEGTVVVIGGGNTAVDVAREAWRLGAEKVIVIYRRTKAEMPADPQEIEDMLEEGVQLMELVAPVGIVKNEEGRLKALKCIRMVLGEPDDSGRRRPVPQEGSEFELPCDWAMPSIGQMPFLTRLLKDSKYAPAVSRWSTFEIDTETMKTNIDGLFAGGDAADDGPTVVIDAIADGQKAAKAIHAYLAGEEIPPKPFIVRKEFWDRPGKKELGDIPESPRRTMHHIPVEERVGNFKEVALGFEYEDMTHECDRCLSCGCLAFDWCDLRLYSEEYGADLGHYKGKVRKHKVDERHPYLVYDPNKCILCARCIRTCEKVLPISALGLVNRGFKTEMRPSMNDPLAETSCIACGNCVDACPTGAILPKFAYKSRAALTLEEGATHCALCSIACPITVKKISDSGYFIDPSGVPGDYLCHDGRFCAELFLKSTRLIEPQRREGMLHAPIDREEAFRIAAQGLRTAVEQYGPENVGVFYYPDLSNEEMYLLGRIARDGLGTNNVASIALLETGVPGGALDESFGFTASTTDRSAIAEADVIVCTNIDPQDELLILSMDIIEAVKERGAKLITAGSAKNPLDDVAELSLDPMRGRAALMWNGVIQRLIDRGDLSREAIAAMDGGEAFLADQTPYDAARIEAVTGVRADRIDRAAELLAGAKRIVVISSPDRSRDLAPGDLQVMANLTLLINARGARCDLILPSLAANGAGVEVCGADPAFGPGRVSVEGLAGARSRAELLEALREGRIKAALILGEDPMATDRTASYFGAVEFLAAIDWVQTETTQFADVAIPGSTPLESEGTRCNFEGKVVRFHPVVENPAGLKNWQALAGIARELGLEIDDDFEALASELDRRVREGVGDRRALVWNTGEDRSWNGAGRLVVADVEAQAAPAVPAFSAIARYRREKLEVGIEHFRVGART